MECIYLIHKAVKLLYNRSEMEGPEHCLLSLPIPGSPNSQELRIYGILKYDSKFLAPPHVMMGDDVGTKKEIKMYFQPTICQTLLHCHSKITL